jgi:hypothetical protein
MLAGEDRTGEPKPMIGAEVYPITLAEMHTYSVDADRLFKGDEHERMKDFLAVHPELGEMIAGTHGVRRLLWPTAPRKARMQVIYYFHDLNMPLYLLAVFGPGEWIEEFDEDFRQQLAGLVDQLLAEHCKQWRRMAGHRDPA